MADITQLMQTALWTGYFGVPGRLGGKVHLVMAADERPVCGSRPGPGAVFLWCSRGIHLDYIECGHCRDVALAILTRQREQEAARLAQIAAEERRQRREKRRAQRIRRQARKGLDLKA